MGLLRAIGINISTKVKGVLQLVIYDQWASLFLKHQRYFGDKDV